MDTLTITLQDHQDAGWSVVIEHTRPGELPTHREGRISFTDGIGHITRALWQTFDLRQWSILAHNLGLADPALLDTLYWPAFVALPLHHRTRLLEESDLYQLGVFFGRFQPDGALGGRVPNLRLPEGAVPDRPEILPQRQVMERVKAMLHGAPISPVPPPR